MGMSLDGFIAGTNRGPTNPLGDRGTTIHTWIFEQRAFRETHGLGSGGKTGADNDRLRATIERIGANIMGKRMFDEGEVSWPEEAPFHTPVFVLTHEKRAPWVRKGGTTFYFVNEGIESALDKAREAAGKKDVRISGGRDVVLQYLHAGLVDEVAIDLAPVLLGEGLRLFEGVDRTKVSLEIADVVPSSAVAHLTYVVKKR
jgi:dihydrofolate reductase